MESIREKLGASESPEDREKKQKQMVLPNILSLALSIAMVIIGYQVRPHTKSQPLPMAAYLPGATRP